MMVVEAINWAKTVYQYGKAGQVCFVQPGIVLKGMARLQGWRIDLNRNPPVPRHSGNALHASIIHL